MRNSCWMAALLMTAAVGVVGQAEAGSPPLSQVEERAVISTKAGGAHLGLEAASPVAQFRISGDSAYADFESVDETGCIVTHVFIGSYAAVEQGPPAFPPFPAPYTAATISQVDVCISFELLMLAFSQSYDTDPVSVSPTLDSATLNANIVASDILTGAGFTIAVRLNWTATGDTEVVNDTSNEHSPGFFFHTQFIGRMRPALATGTVTALGTNFTPYPSTEAQIQSLDFGELIIEREEPATLYGRRSERFRQALAGLRRFQNARYYPNRR